MRDITWKDGSTERSPARVPWRYGLLAEELELDGVFRESYGIVIWNGRTGEKTAARHITTDSEQAFDLFDRVTRLGVSPVTLRDIVEDFLGR